MMDFKNPDFSLRQLQYAVAVQVTGGFSRAAERCGVAQPSLSAQVAKLEDVLGVKLFERDSRTVIVTAAGEVLLERMRAVLAAAGDLEAAAAASVNPYALPVRVGVIPTVAPYLVPAVVEALFRRHPAPTVHWIERHTHHLEDALERGELDAILIADPPRFDAASEDIAWERFVAIVPEGSSLSGPLDLDGFSREPVLLLEDGHCLRDQTMALCMQPGASESPYRATSLPTLVQMVASGLGVSVLPESALPVELPRAHVRTLAFESDNIGRTLVFAWRRGSPREDVLRELVEIVREVARDATAGRPL